MADAAEERNQPPPGAEHTRLYTAEEKAHLLEQFILARAAKEGTDIEICARLGVSRTAIYRWKAILEQGGDLENFKSGPRTMAAKKKRNRSAAGVGRGGGASVETRIQAAQEHLANPGNGDAVAKKYGVSTATIYSWVKQYKAGDLNAPGRKVNGHGQPAQVVMFEEAPKHAIQRAAPNLMTPADTDLKMQLALAHAEIARLKQRNRKLAQLVGDDE